MGELQQVQLSVSIPGSSTDEQVAKFNEELEVHKQVNNFRSSVTHLKRTKKFIMI